MELNAQQNKAVKHIEGPVMVLAGPGTGKTQIIAARITEILKESQLDPHNILCLTFTESGVVAMRKRLIQFVGEAAYAVRIHTFHSFCNDVIKENPEAFLFSRELNSITDLERMTYLEEMIDALPATSPLKPFAAPDLYIRDIQKNIQDLKREAISPDDFEALVQSVNQALDTHTESIETFVTTHARSLTPEHYQEMYTKLQDSALSDLIQGDPSELDSKERTKWKSSLKKEFESLKKSLPKQSDLAKLYRHYQKLLKERGRYDYEDMILFVVQAFETNSDILASYQEQFQYILVDEYQDTNGAQNKVVEYLSQNVEKPNIFVVGDDKQSIYRFQGASLENILYFYKKFKDDIELISLKENYRSQQVVLDAADALIQFNKHGMHHFLPDLSLDLHSQKEEREQIQIAELESPQAEIHFITEQIKNDLKSGIPASEIAVFSRNNKELDPLTDSLLKAEIDFHLMAGENILNSIEIQKWLRLLRVIENPEENRQLFFLLHDPLFTLNPIEIVRLNQQSRSNKRSYLEEMLATESPQDPFEAPDAPQKETKLKRIANKLLEWKSRTINQPLVQALEHILKESGWLKRILSSENKLEELNQMNRFFDEVKQLNQSNKELRLDDLLKHLELLNKYNLQLYTQELKTKRNGIKLMTAHRSKGLEFQKVYILNCVHKNWEKRRVPSKLKLPPGILKNEKGLDAMHKIEDERRLFYVGLTRAKQSITLSYAANNLSGRPQTPSVFLSEIPDELKVEIDVTPFEENIEDQLLAGITETPVKKVSTDLEDYLKARLEHYKMSVTHFLNYLRCPRLFYYRNVLRVPETKNKNLAFGTAAHEALKDLIVSLQKGHAPTKENLLKRFEHHLAYQILSTKDFNWALEYGSHQLSSYFDANKNNFNANVFVEYDFSSHGVNCEGVPLTGKLDKIEIIDPDNKRVHVVDYKTGNPDNKRDKLKEDGDYRIQIAFYQLLCDHSTKFPYKMKSGEIDFIEESKKTGTHKREVMEIGREELDKLKVQIKDVYEDIQNLRFLHIDEWEACGECDYCEELS